MLKNYYTLVKPGIVYGNVFTTLAGFLFASQWRGSLCLLVATLAGMALVIASGCVFNNYIDRAIDRKMLRTSTRALATGAISTRNALVYGAVLGLAGFFILYIYVNTLTAAVALVGFIFYVGIYSFAKRVSHWGTVVGSVAGATPIVAGYTAFAGRLDIPALILFLILALWQMPHFYAIAMYRLEDYRAAGIPVLPLQKGMKATKLYIIFYVVLYLAAASALTMFGYAGYVYFACVWLFGLVWLRLAVRGFKVSNDALWARKFFLFSLVVLVSFSVAVSVASISLATMVQGLFIK